MQLSQLHILVIFTGENNNVSNIWREAFWIFFVCKFLKMWFYFKVHIFNSIWHMPLIFDFYTTLKHALYKIFPAKDKFVFTVKVWGQNKNCIQYFLANTTKQYCKFHSYFHLDFQNTNNILAILFTPSTLHNDITLGNTSINMNAREMIQMQQLFWLRKRQEDRNKV